MTDNTHLAEKEKTPFWKAPQVPDWLATLYAPIQPELSRLVHIERKGPRGYKPEDILVPEGFTAELVAGGFNAPAHCTFDDQGNCYVVETGHKVDAAPRILKIDVRTGAWETFYTLPESKWHMTGAVTGACWLEGWLYVMNTDTLFRVNAAGRTEDLVTDLPGIGDHQANAPIAGPDGKIYFGVGVATNCGVVGRDDAAFEWLAKHPEFHDIPAQDITLVGRNYESPDILGSVTDKVSTGAYSPFGRPTSPGQVVPGQVKSTGSILRCNPDGSELEVVAWGFRNPFGLAFGPDGRLFATEHGMDERGQRYVPDDPDDFYAVEPGRWYGFPDFASGIRLDDPAWGEGGRGREPVLAEHPEANPPRPIATFQTHAAANGMDFCRDPAFGFPGQAFVACFGDLAPITTLKRALAPAGFKVVRVDPVSGQVTDFAVNKIAGPASMLPHDGFERPSHCLFGPDGALYVVDYGIIKIALEAGGIRAQQETGALWRIRRSEGPRGDAPPPSIEAPVYGLRYAAAAIVAAGIFVGILLAGPRLSRWLRR
jgi:glucose/arabinose dehydrogenase